METTAVPNPSATAAEERARSPRWVLWTGRAVSALPVVALVASAALKIARPPQVVAVFTSHLGYLERALASLAVLELLCVVLYVVPRTAVLGAVLMTAFLGGAVATHVRVGDPFAIPTVLGILAWLGLWLREGRLRALLPLRR